MKRLGAAALALVPGGLVVGGAAMFAACYSAARTGIAEVDRWAIRGSAVLGLFAAFTVKMRPAVARAFVAGVTVNEGAYVPDEWAPGALYPLGDQGHRLGPAVSPWQILSGLHLRRLGYDGDPLELAKVGAEWRAAMYAARIFREAFDAAGGDLREAIRRYNGSGPAAEKYADKAMRRIDDLGGLA